jgi:uncharacterized protein (TIGR03083 family)
MSVPDLARAEREELADLLETLTPQQWDAPSLCERWRVRDVVAHVVSYDRLGAAALAQRFVRGRLLLDRVNQVGVDEHRERDPQELVALLRRHAVPSGLSAGFGGRIALVDTLVHAQDVRRPLGLLRSVPAERLRAALPFALLAPPLRALWHVRGVRVVATDVDWAAGAGPEARGPGEAVLMAMGGRRGAARELTGPGADRLVRRLG